jgi:hypothetical protein
MINKTAYLFYHPNSSTVDLGRPGERPIVTCKIWSSAVCSLCAASDGAPGIIWHKESATRIGQGWPVLVADSFTIDHNRRSFYQDFVTLFVTDDEKK